MPDETPITSNDGVVAIEVNKIVTTDNTNPDKVQEALQALPQVKVVPAISIKNPWVCQKCGAIIGSVYHEKIRANLGISRLILFRGAVRLEESLPENYIFGKVDAGEFGCSRCGEVRHWRPSQEALIYLSENRRKNKKP